MDLFSQSGETNPLIKEPNTNKNWRQIFFKWSTVKILFGIVVLGAIFYLLYTIINNENQPKETKTQRNRSIRVFSTATTNNDFFRQCAPSVKCNPNTKYRSDNGSCNNLAMPTWGASGTPFYRMMNANYNDGYYELRRQSNGVILPNARTIHIKVFMNREIYKMDENNVLLVPFAQFLAHDISDLPPDFQLVGKNVKIGCCTDENTRKSFPQCQLAIEYQPDDPFYGKYNATCDDNYRSYTSRNYSCPLYPTTFINEATHFIDASQVYGSNENDSQRLRLMEGGRLNFSTSDNGEMFCPFIPDKVVKSTNGLNSKYIQYDTGNELNGNQNLGITSMHTLFLRFHNYIAFELASLNPHWSDETLYQESRRIVIAAIQRIAYKDLLPIIIGEDFQDVYGLYNGNDYDPTINPATSMEMTSTVFRVLHTLIPVKFNLMNQSYEIVSSVNLMHWMSNPTLLQIDNNFDRFLNGFLETPGRLSQPSYNYDVSNNLFGQTVPALDLLAKDITRGRDTGLQPYNQVRHLCGLPLAETFDDLMDVIHEHDISRLKELYYSVNDIDLHVGLLLEKHSNGAIVGPTTRCLIADSFYRHKAGDRFFYDVQGQPSSFTPDQLKTIEKITLGHVMCAVSNVAHVQTEMFKTIDHNLFSASKLKCVDGFRINFGHWKEPSASSCVHT